MSIKKMALANAKQLSKEEMKRIRAGSPPVDCNCNSADNCSAPNPVCGASTTCVNSGYQGLCQSQ